LRRHPRSSRSAERLDGQVRVRDIARQDYALARREEAVDEVTRRMLLRNAENVVVVEGHGATRPVGVVRAADILRLRR